MPRQLELMKERTTRQIIMLPIEVDASIISTYYILTNSTLFPVQTNVYPSAVRRKMRSFDGFKRRAVVIVPADDEFQRRVAKREAEEGKDVPDSAVLEMKGVFFVLFVCVCALSGEVYTGLFILMFDGPI